MAKARSKPAGSVATSGEGAPAETPPKVELYTDGACSGNPGPGGWAYLLRHPVTMKEREDSGGETEGERAEAAAKAAQFSSGMTNSVAAGMNRLPAPFVLRHVTGCGAGKAGTVTVQPDDQAAPRTDHRDFVREAAVGHNDRAAGRGDLCLYRTNPVVEVFVAASNAEMLEQRPSFVVFPAGPASRCRFDLQRIGERDPLEAERPAEFVRCRVLPGPGFANKADERDQRSCAPTVPPRSAARPPTRWNTRSPAR